MAASRRKHVVSILPNFLKNSRQYMQYHHRTWLPNAGCRLLSKSDYIQVPNFNPVYPRRFVTDVDSSKQAEVNSARTIDELFLRKDVQNILRRITAYYPERVFSAKQGEQQTLPYYQLLTKDQMEKLKQEFSKKRPQELLTIPPGMEDRKPCDVVLETNERLMNHEKNGCKLLFADITYGVKDRDRIIVVREPDGVLRTATWEERDRMNAIFYPKYAREVRVPGMFQDPFFEEVVKSKKYEYILERAFVQFEPDDPRFTSAAYRVYEEVSRNEDFETLRSTRWFGHMVFYLIRVTNIDNLLLDCIKRDLLENADDLVQLYCLLHPDSQINSELKKLKSSGFSSECIARIKLFAQHCCTDSSRIENALSTYEYQDTAAMKT